MIPDKKVHTSNNGLAHTASMVRGCL